VQAQQKKAQVYQPRDVVTQCAVKAFEGVAYLPPSPSCPLLRWLKKEDATVWSASAGQRVNLATTHGHQSKCGQESIGSFKHASQKWVMRKSENNSHRRSQVDRQLWVQHRLLAHEVTNETGQVHSHHKHH